MIDLPNRNNNKIAKKPPNIKTSETRHNVDKVAAQ